MKTAALKVRELRLLAKGRVSESWTGTCHIRRGATERKSCRSWPQKEGKDALPFYQGFTPYDSGAYQANRDLRPDSAVGGLGAAAAAGIVRGDKLYSAGARRYQDRYLVPRWSGLWFRELPHSP